MKRVWVVDDRIPIHALYDGPHPLSLDRDIVQHLIENVAGDAWDEPEVLSLCRSLCAEDYDLTFFRSPEALVHALEQGLRPPHAVIFDWEYPGGSPDRNCDVLERLLSTSFAYVQVYTHLGADGVEPTIADLRERHGSRLLQTKMKGEVSPEVLSQQIRDAWDGTIAGELADEVRSQLFAAAERALVDICTVPRTAISAMSESKSENLVQLVLSKVRDEIDTDGSDTLEKILSDEKWTGTDENLRRLMSVWYYSFPADDRVRRYDLIEFEGDLGLVVTPACDLANFPKKAGGCLTWLRAIPLDNEGVRRLRTAGLELNMFGNSIVADHGKAGDAIVVLPNVPLECCSRDQLGDYLVMCHGWESRVFPSGKKGPLFYADLKGLKRRCTLVHPFAGAVVARASSVLSAWGTPDLPKGERDRLGKLVTSIAPTEVSEKAKAAAPSEKS